MTRPKLIHPHPPTLTHSRNMATHSAGKCCRRNFLPIWLMHMFYHPTTCVECPASDYVLSVKHADTCSMVSDVCEPVTTTARYVWFSSDAPKHPNTHNSLYSSNKSRFECVESWPQFTNNKHTIFCPGAFAQCKCFDIISTVARKQHSCRLYIFIKIYWHIRRKRESTIIHIRQVERMFSHAINNAICMCCSALSHGLSKSSPNPNLESSSANKTQVVA